MLGPRKAQIDAGIVPVISLYSIRNSVKTWSWPISMAGTRPVSELLCKYKSRRTSLLAKFEGIEPVSSLSKKYKIQIFGRSNIEVGSCPVNELIPKSANSRFLKFSKASQMGPRNSFPRKARISFALPIKRRLVDRSSKIIPTRSRLTKVSEGSEGVRDSTGELIETEP